MPKKHKRKRKMKTDFTRTSKKIGIIIAIVVIMIIIYILSFTTYLSIISIGHEIQPDLTPINTLIGGALAVTATYVGFYINMSKAEHIENKKNGIARQIKRIEEDGITSEEQLQLTGLKEQLEKLDGDLDNISIEEDIKTFL